MKRKIVHHERSKSRTLKFSKAETYRGGELNTVRLCLTYLPSYLQCHLLKLCKKKQPRVNTIIFYVVSGTYPGPAVGEILHGVLQIMYCRSYSIKFCNWKRLGAIYNKTECEFSVRTQISGHNCSVGVGQNLLKLILSFSPTNLNSYSKGMQI
jgi:hypothetical protein